MDYSSLVSAIFDDCLGVEAGDSLWIDSWDHTLDLAAAIGSECVRRRCPYLATVRYEDVWLRSISELPAGRLRTVPPQMRAALARTDFFVFTLGPRRPVDWGLIPKAKRKLVSVWLDTRYDRSPYAREWAKISRANGVRVLAIEATLATPERAKALGLNYEEWRHVMFQGCLADAREIVRRSTAMAGILSAKGRVRISTSSGTELSFDLDKRNVEVSDGVATNEKAEKGWVTFLPAGSVEVSVKEGSAEGKVVYDAPVHMGSQTIEGLEVDLKNGKITGHTAARGAEALDRYLREGGRGAPRFAFLGFGVNPNLRLGFTQDDKVLGGVTLGFGDNRAMGGKNVASDQWWACVSKATASVDGTEIMDEGRLLV